MRNEASWLDHHLEAACTFGHTPWIFGDWREPGEIREKKKRKKKRQIPALPPKTRMNEGANQT